jgi:PAS domain S-box-containing protein
MSRSQRRAGYIVAVITTLLVLLARLGLERVLADQARLLPFMLAVMAAAWWGGLRPGLLATFLAAFLGVLFVVPPSDSLSIETAADGLNAALFVIVGVTISILFEELHAARRNEADKQFRTLADTVAQLVWMAHPNGHRFWFNQRWYDYTGTTLDEVKGDGWQAFCDPADLPQVLSTWNAALAVGVPWESTYRLRAKNGTPRWFLARSVPIRNEMGEIVRWYGTSTDIQDRIEIEQALREADARKDQYLATLAHELRNPLSPISNALSLWPHVADDKIELERLRAVIGRQLKQLVRLIDDLLDVARFSRGKIVLRKQTVGLADVIHAAVESVKPMIDAGGHQLTLAIPRQPIYINADSARLMQVFANILNNAAKYSVRNGAIAIAVEKSGVEALVRIRDNGPGIPTSMLDKIFEPFVQVNRTVDSSQGGLGIGLTLAQQLVKLHGGKIEAHSDGAKTSTGTSRPNRLRVAHRAAFWLWMTSRSRRSFWQACFAS